MQRIFRGLVTLGCLAQMASFVPGQDVLYYKFDARGGDKVINYARGSIKGPDEGTLQGNATARQRWAKGLYGGALYGGETSRWNTRQNYVDTGWAGAFSGSFTVAWLMKLRGQQAGINDLSYLFSGVGSFRCFTNGLAGKGLMVRGWGGKDLQLKTDIQALAAKGWVHVALVVNDKAKVAVWYVNGKAQAPIKISKSPKVSKGKRSFLVGFHETLQTPFQYDVDEFRFSLKATPALELLAWASGSQAADSPYGKACGGKLGALYPGQIPWTRTGRYGVRARFTRAGPVLFLLGSSRTSLFGFPGLLPFDLGPFFSGLKGCPLQTSMQFILATSAGSNGIVDFPLPIPGNSKYAGMTLYVQCLLLSSGKQESTNGWAISIR